MKGAGLQRVQLRPGNWFAPLGSNRSGSGATLSVDGSGFRGAAGLQLSGTAGFANTDYVRTAPTTYTGTAVAGAHGSKGEGIAGTPRWIESGVTFANTGVEGYPNGSMAKGAPGNAGGGGTDADPAANDQNSGGAGGGNGGIRGAGGNAWNSNLSSGGLGGSAFPSTLSRAVMGGGGGAGTRNNSPGDAQASSGAAGGGIVIIRAGNLSGTAAISANGAAAYIGISNDAGGGGGAGGSIIVVSASGGEGGLTVLAHGGRGGDAWDTQAFTIAERHGPGGGGGGGAVFLSGAAASIDVTAGASGTTLNPGVPYGATSGNAGSFTKVNFRVTSPENVSKPSRASNAPPEAGPTRIGLTLSELAVLIGNRSEDLPVISGTGSPTCQSSCFQRMARCQSESCGWWMNT